MTYFKSLYLNTQLGSRLFIDYYNAGADKPNLIFCWTNLEVGTVTEFRKCYEPFIAYGYNIFAMDFTGRGKEPFSEKSLTDDFQCLLGHIRSLNSNPIFVFGDTGIGGIWGQYVVSSSKGISGFAQFGCAVHRNVSPLGYSKGVIAFIYPILTGLAKLFPKVMLTLSIPKYSGYHAKEDNNFYRDMIEKHPNAFKTSFSYVKTLMYVLWDKKSPIRNELTIPTLVFKTMHDRYFPTQYFDMYYEHLRGPKKLVKIDDVHNSYFFYPVLFAKEVAEWFGQCIIDLQ